MHSRAEGGEGGERSTKSEILGRILASITGRNRKVWGVT